MNNNTSAGESMTLEKGLAAFLDALLGKNRSSATIRAYRTDVLQCITFLKEHDMDSTTQLCYARVAPLAPYPTGNAVFNYPSSMLFAPVVTVPLIRVSGMPVGVQLMGQQHDDARITAMARWLLETVPPVVVR
jgi:Asp-tRNA(Asn)/Glu-tRNA(Gln) amidotransferase A subunit family amidase